MFSFVHVTVTSQRTKPTRANLTFLLQILLYMLPRLSPFLRPLHPLLLSSAATPMARVLTRAAPVRLSHTTNVIASICISPRLGFDTNTNRFGVSPSLKSSLSGRGFHALCRDDGRGLTPLGRVWASQQREYRKVRRRAVKSKEKELELNVSICIEEDLPDDPEVLVPFPSVSFIVI